MLAAQFFALSYCKIVGIKLDYTMLGILLIITSIITIISWWRLSNKWPVTDQEYLLHLLVDLSLLTALLYFSGGATNPFVSYYLVPLSISAAILPWRYTWFVAGISLLCYSMLLFFYQPIDILMPAMQHNHSQSKTINPHIIGMWLNFMLSAALITYFVVKMASALRQQDARLSADREDELRDEQIMAVATLAAGTAHELGTPLSTIAVLLHEMDNEQYFNDNKENNTELKQDIQLLKQQVSSCKNILQNLVAVAEKRSHKEQELQAIDQFIAQVLEHWKILRPDLKYQYRQLNPQTAPQLLTETTLEQAITNLLNNAADASRDLLEIELDWDIDNITLTIRDDGDGISTEIAEQMGKPFVSTKGKGLGLGLFLSHSTISRYGGSIRLFNTEQGGTQAELTLPIYQAATINNINNSEPSHE